jgi:hypothetical protein
VGCADIERAFLLSTEVVEFPAYLRVTNVMSKSASSHARKAIRYECLQRGERRGRGAAR